jgi:hypothetical protein
MAWNDVKKDSNSSGNKVEYKFAKLPTDHCQNILDKNKIKFTAKEPMTLAEIFNTDSDNVVVSKELIQEKRMGFC